MKANDGRELRMKITPAGEAQRQALTRNEIYQGKAEERKGSKLGE